MLFREIIDGKYKVFSRMSQDEKTRNIGIIKYVQTLASLASVDIREWDAQKLFGAGTGNKLLDNKNDINRIFFEEVERIAAAAPKAEAGTTPEGELVISDDLKTQLKAAESKHLANLVATEQQNADTHLEAARKYYKDFEKRITQAGQHLANIRRLTGNSSNLEEQIKQVHNGSFWKFHEITDGNKISFVSRADIHLTHKNPAAGVDISLNFGRFKATFYVSDLTIRVVGFERNIFVHGYPHPHINPHGNPCWGSAGSMVPPMLASCNFAEPLLLLATIMSAYNKDSPLRSMEEFQDVVGSPEETEARDAMNATRDAARNVMTPLDERDLDIDMWAIRPIPQPDATPPAAEPTLTEQVDQAIAAAERLIYGSTVNTTTTNTTNVTF